MKPLGGVAQLFEALLRALPQVDSDYLGQVKAAVLADCPQTRVVQLLARGDVDHLDVVCRLDKLVEAFLWYACLLT